MLRFINRFAATVARGDSQDRNVHEKRRDTP
jgi:hypothetical protein